MKVSFSRKGFDSANGNQPNAIMPDGHLLPFPIPSSDKDTYGKLCCGNQSLFDIVVSLKPKTKLNPNSACHLDPDLCKDVKPRHIDWKAAFGQSNQSLSELYNSNFGKGDLFLFFGWFRETELKNGKLKYKKGTPNIHLIYGYLEVGEIIKTGMDIPEWLEEHPHACRIKSGSIRDAIFLPTDSLSFMPQLPGAAMLKFAPELVLTAPGKSRSKWELPDFFKYIDISHAPKQPENREYFQSASIGQEMVWETADIPEALDWLKKICNNAIL